MKKIITVLSILVLLLGISGLVQAAANAPSATYDYSDMKQYRTLNNGDYFPSKDDGNTTVTISQVKNAFSKNGTINAHYGCLLYSGNTNVYCLQHNVSNPTKDWNAKVIKKYVLDNKQLYYYNSSKPTTRCDGGKTYYNGKAAYILSFKKNKTGQAENNNPNSYQNANTQIALWKIVENWLGSSYSGGGESRDDTVSDDATTFALKATYSSDSYTLSKDTTTKAFLTDTGYRIGPIVAKYSNAKYTEKNVVKTVYSEVTELKVTCVDLDGNDVEYKWTKDQLRFYYPSGEQESYVPNNKAMYIEFDFSKNIKTIKSIRMSYRMYNVHVEAYEIRKKKNNSTDDDCQKMLIVTNSYRKYVYGYKDLDLNLPLTAKLVINKVDENDITKKLSGAKFILKLGKKYIKKSSTGQYSFVSNEGEATRFATDSSGSVTINNLPRGEYTLIETNYPTGYTYCQKETAVVLDGTSKTITVKNKLITGDLVIDKVDANNSSYKLAGAKFILKKDGKYLKAGAKEFTFETLQSAATVYTTDSNGKISISGLPIGDYTLIETSAPNGYNIQTSSTNVTITNNNTITQQIKNNVQTGNILIDKVDVNNSNIKLAGAQFVIMKSGQYLKEDSTGFNYVGVQSAATIYITDSNGNISINNLPIGDYTLVEISAPDGYQISASQVSVSVKDATTEKKTIENRKKTGTLVITKVDADDITKKLSGATFILKNGNSFVKDLNTSIQLVDNESEATIYTTDSNGNVSIYNLIPGDYTVIEKNAPQNYSIKTNNTTVTIIDKEIKDITIENNIKTGDLLINKVDKDNNSIKLSEAKFILKQDNKFVKFINGKCTYVSTQTDATVYITDTNGAVTVSNLPVGEYKLVEVNAPQNYILNSDQITVIIQADSIETKIVENKVKTGNLYISKVDEYDTSIGLIDAKFVLKQGEKYLRKDEYGIYREVLTQNEATVFTTNMHGNVSIDNIPVGNYTLVEIEAPTKYNITTANTDVTIIADNTLTKTITNRIKTGSLRINKVEKDNTAEKLQNAKFVLKQGSSYIKAEGPKYTAVSTEAEATVYTTDANGVININNIPIGAYTLVEIEAPQHYEIITKNTAIVINENQITLKTIENKLLCYNVSGYVFLDTPQGKDSKCDGLYTIADKKLPGIVVKLYNIDNTLLSTTTTNSKGEYSFNRISEIYKTYVKFEYDGYDYIPTTHYSKIGYKWGNSSVGLENSQDRDKFNYRTAPNNTISAYSNNGSGMMYFTVDTSGVNLGLQNRPEFDLALMQDIDKVQIKVKGYEQEYNYNSRQLDKLSTSDKVVDINERLSQKYYDRKYQRDIYDGDYNYDASGAYNIPGVYISNETELEAYVTYKIRVMNQSQSLKGKVKEVVDYYDSDYTFIKAEFNNRTLTAKDSSTYTGNQNIAQVNQGIAKRIYLTGFDNQLLSSGDSLYMYVTFKVNKDRSGKLLLDNENTGKQNVAEIYSCESYYARGYEIPNYGVVQNDTTPAGILDRDSTPANLVDIYNIRAYEDDTDAAPAISFILTYEDRSITGTVWDDERNVKNDTQLTTVGNGIYDRNEKGIASVEVQLYEIIDSKYTSDGKEHIAYIKNAFTDANGNYCIDKFAPGKYFVTFVYGSNEGSSKYNGQDYKSTTYFGNIDYNNIDNIAEFDYWADLSRGISYSDAKDVMGDINTKGTRKYVNNYCNNNGNGKVTNALAEQLANMNTNDFYQNVYMRANTGYMNLGIEFAKQDKITTNSSYYYLGKGIGIKAESYNVPDIDFGLQERPKAQISINKEVTNVKVNTSDNKILFDATHSMSHVIWLKGEETGVKLNNNMISNNLRNIKGIAQFVVDQEYMYGSAILISYKITAKNVGEVDYDDAKFYYTGVVSNVSKLNDYVVKTSVNQIVDYVENNLKFESVPNAGWNEIEKNKLFETGLVNYRLTKPVKQYSVVIEKSLDNELLPEMFNKDKSSICTDLILSQLTLNDSGDSFLYNNLVEVVKVTNSVGRRMAYSVVGNQDPSMEPTEIDTDDSEDVILIPPTGMIKEVAGVVTIATSALGIVICGIIIIKKRIIKKEKII